MTAHGTLNIGALARREMQSHRACEAKTQLRSMRASLNVRDTQYTRLSGQMEKHRGIRSNRGGRIPFHLVVIFLMPLALAGCGRSQREQAAECQLQARIMQPNAADSIVGNLTEVCMEAHGYKWNSRECFPEERKYSPQISYNFVCYEPSDLIAGLISRMKVVIGAD
jgi:hypothetical protein